MVSSTLRDLGPHRAAVRKALEGQHLHPVAMEQDSARPNGTVIESSLEKVHDCAAFVGIIGHLYGEIPESDLNPDRLSLTELEFREARRLGRPMLIFIMSEDHPVRKADIERDPGKTAKLAAFREEVKRDEDDSGAHRVYRTFDDLQGFEVAVVQAVAELRRHLDAAAKPVTAGARSVREGAIPELADCYQARTEAAQLIEAIAAGGTAAVTHVLSGLGGVGKSQLAAALARKHADTVDVLLWADAGTRSGILTAYQNLAHRLDCPHRDDPEQAASWLLARLQEGAYGSWLIVLDDLADPADLQGLWPSGPSGAVVVTTRRTDAALFTAGRRRVELGVYSPEQAAAYLVGKLALPDDASRLVEAEQLADDVGCLPLALAQATAFMANNDESCTGYRQLLAKRRGRLTDVFPADALADDYRQTVAATWSISVEAADRLTPAGVAGPLLELAGMLDPNGFPIELVGTAAARDYLLMRRPAPSAVDDRPGAIEEHELDERDCRYALHNLARMSVLTIDRTSPTSVTPGGGPRVRVHALVQRAALEQLPPDRLQQVARAAANALLAVWPNIERDTGLGQVLRANAGSLITRAGAALWTSGPHPVLRRLGQSLGEAGLVNDAAEYWDSMVGQAQQHLGADHPDTLGTRAQLIRWLGEAGNPTGAATAAEQLLAEQQRILGPDHPETLTSRNNLAYWRGLAGDLTGAATAMEQLLADYLRVSGPDDPHTLTTRGNLAHLRGMAGDPAGAASIVQQLLADQQRLLGPDHPATLLTRNNLAYWLGTAGDHTAAVTAFAQLLADRQRVLGHDHPDTLLTRANLVSSQGEAGGSAAAATACEQLLIDARRVLGSDHPTTLTVRDNLARWQGEAGDPPAAAAAYQQLFPDILKIFGPDHPGTFTVRGNLARWQGRAGNPTAAATAYEQLLTDIRRVLGADHPDTLAVRHNLAHWQGEAGDPTAAATKLEQLLADRVRVLGPDHPDTLTTRTNLAYWRGQGNARRGD
jgi:hypothetical protein